MKHSKERNSADHSVRNPQKTSQPKSVQNNQPGYGDKKLEGPNRPST